MDTKTLLFQKLKQARLLPQTEFIILYGSVSRKESTPLSDIDICISLNLPTKERLKARITLSGELPDKFDIQIFEDLPIYVQKEVLGGILLYCKQKTKLIDRAINLIREFEDFEPIYNQYLAQAET